MRIAFAGLATSHPYTDARTLSRRAELIVWEPDEARLRRFLDEHPSARAVESLPELLSCDPDGVVLTVPTPLVASSLEPVLRRDLPCFVNKPAAATVAQLAELDEVVSLAPHRFLSASVLRFAPAITSLSLAGLSFAGLSFARDEILSARVTVRHDTGLWATGYNPWQDDPGAGGGMLAILGIHGVELLVALFGPSVTLAGAAVAKRWHTGLRSEDTAVLSLRWSDGPLGTVEVLGVAESESYAVTVHTASGEHGLTLTAGAEGGDPLGYLGTAQAFLDMVAGAPSPVPWEQTRAVLSVLVQARALVSRGG